jgi:hypothetical protein
LEVKVDAESTPACFLSRARARSETGNPIFVSVNCVKPLDSMLVGQNGMPNLRPKLSFCLPLKPTFKVCLALQPGRSRHNEKDAALSLVAKSLKCVRQHFLRSAFHEGRLCLACS